jgi:predicted ATPase
VVDVASLLRSGARLVTLSGPGGSGKTRLAIEAAAELVGDFRNGVFWVGLATLRDPALVLPTIAQAIGAHEELPAHIGQREQLLLLDNLEQVIGVAPDLAGLVEACPNLRLLVTSRELLRVRGEVEYEVLPLAEPDAVELFCLRSQLTANPAVEELCRRLDSMPLALELAAARTKVLSPEQIVERLAQRLDLLKGGRDADPRQATLRATIEWSHDLLDPGEQRLFARLSVFPGSTLAAVEAICDADLDRLQSLVEKSLARRTGERFWMLETIREFAAERLEHSGEAEAIRRRHGTYFLDVAESTCLAVERVGQGAMRYDLALAEQDNFRAALDWALDNDPALGLRMAVELEQFWVSRDPYEGARRIEALFERADDLTIELRAAALRVFGGTSTVSGEHRRAEPLYEESLGLYEQLGDEWGVVHLRHRLAVCAMLAGDWGRARALGEENLARARALASTYLEAEAMSLLAGVAHNDGDLENALELTRGSVERMHALGFTWFEAGGRLGMAEYAFELGRLPEAESGARSGLALCRSMGERVMTVYVLTLLAAIARRRGDADRAGRLWGAAEAEEERAPVGWSKDDIDRFRDQVLADGGPELEAGREAGRRLSLDEAIAYALDESDG